MKANDDEIEIVVYELTHSATDSDDEVRVLSIQLGGVRVHTQLLEMSTDVDLVRSTPILHIRERIIN